MMNAHSIMIDADQSLLFEPPSATSPLHLEIAYAAWMRSYPFTVFLTLTFPQQSNSVKRVPDSATIAITDHLRALSKDMKATLGALGFVVLGKSGHLHAHLLILEKRGRGFSEEELFAFGVRWRWQAVAKRIDQLDGVASYIASPNHLRYTKGTELFSYGAKILHSSNAGRETRSIH